MEYTGKTVIGKRGSTSQEKAPKTNAAASGGASVVTQSHKTPAKGKTVAQASTADAADAAKGSTDTSYHSVQPIYYIC